MIVSLKLMGRFGNQLFQYAFARGYCERHGHELRTDPWIGQQIFNLNELPAEPMAIRHNEETILAGIKGDVEVMGYFQNQKSIDHYTRRQVREWFTFRPDVLARLQPCPHRVIAHRRAGDYASAGYPVISEKAIRTAVAQEFPAEARNLVILSDETGPPDFLQDFYTLLTAPTLFRSNSSFSWWAATLGHGEVFSPWIEGLHGGREHDEVPYTRGNWPRLAELSFVTDLFLKE